MFGSSWIRVSNPPQDAILPHKLRVRPSSGKTKWHWDECLAPISATGGCARAGSGNLLDTTPAEQVPSRTRWNIPNNLGVYQGMFDQTLMLDAGRQRPWTVFAGLSGQLLALGTAMLIPLVYTDQLPMFRFSELHILAPAGRPEPPPETALAQRQVTTQTTPTRTGTFYAPAHTPAKVLIVDDPIPGPDAANPPYVVGAMHDPHAATSGILARVGLAPPPPEPRAASAEKAVTPEPAITRIKIGGAVQEARIVNRVMPTYPALARQARVSGTVQLLGIIGKDGRVAQLQVISGHPLLVTAALDAVRQWTYRPTLLNGDPVEVVAPIEVRFTLNQ